MPGRVLRDVPGDGGPRLARAETVSVPLDAVDDLLQAGLLALVLRVGVEPSVRDELRHGAAALIPASSAGAGVVVRVAVAVVAGQGDLGQVKGDLHGVLSGHRSL